MRVLPVRGRTGRSGHRLSRRIKCLMTYGRFCPHVRRFPGSVALPHPSHDAAETLDTWFRSPSAPDPLVRAQAVSDDDRVLTSTS